MGMGMDRYRGLWMLICLWEGRLEDDELEVDELEDGHIMYTYSTYLLRK